MAEIFNQMRPKPSAWIYTALLCIAALFAGCNKDYEDGPAISLRSKEARVTGQKHIKSYVVNGIDSTFVFDSIYARTSYATQGLYFDHLGSDFTISCGACQAVGFWELLNGGKQITIYLPFTFDGVFGYRGAYDIQRLSDRELWVNAVVSGKIVQIKFEDI